jgi:hypothetical protein
VNCDVDQRADMRTYKGARGARRPDTPIKKSYREAGFYQPKTPGDFGLRCAISMCELCERGDQNGIGPRVERRT